ncbi:MAG: DNA polymerase III subunit delta' [Gammaproteobacteria bacterium]|nr:DNA polymerase III subunit delta' [Gammaproteobacteria bacterium]
MNAPAAVPPYPWQAGPWGQMAQARAAGRLGHALLLAGPVGLGKGELAVALARALLCESPAADESPCGRCRSCHLVAVGTHPDLTRLVPEEEGRQIRVEDVRDWRARSALTSQLGGHKVAIIEPADAMNVSAANSLLKTLEEPTPETTQILVTAAPHRLPATIRSRCQRVHVGTPPQEVALRWLRAQRPDAPAALCLALAGGAPLAALALAEPAVVEARARGVAQFVAVAEGRESPVQVAADWLATDWPRLLGWLAGWLSDLARLRHGAAAPLHNPDQAAVFQRLAARVDSKVLYGLVDHVLQTRRATGSNLNHQLVLESLLTRWANALPTPSHRHT